MGTWIDFTDLRAQLNFADVLRHYRVEVKAKRDQHHGYCPLPNHNGKRNSPSFSANLKLGIFNCFGCGARGNILEFAAMMQRLDASNGRDLRTVAIELRDKFCPTFGNTAKQSKKTSAPKRAEAEQFELPSVAREQASLSFVINAPLDFELKNLDTQHPYLDKRGFTPETIRHFGLGYCSKGLLEGRIAIPIHNHEGKLVAYCGRIIDDKLINEENPRYKFPPKRERSGVTYEFHKLALLYNSHRLKPPVDDLIIVEGFASVWWLTQMGISNVVAVMGSVMSKPQAEIVAKLVPKHGRVWIIPDGDDSGVRFARSVFMESTLDRFLKWLKLDDGKQPTDYPGGWFRSQMG